MHFGVFENENFIPNNSLAELCGDISNCRKIAFIGAGGKTTLLLHLAAELARRQKRVLITTTTHIQNPFPQVAPDGTILSRSLLLPAVPADSVTIAGTVQGNKLGPLPADELARQETAYDYLLVEADGSKRLPVKCPAAYEPVLSAGTDLIICVLGLDAIGRPLADIAHRPELLAALLGTDKSHLLTPADLQKVFPQLINKQEKHTKKLIYILNKVNSDRDLQQGRAVASGWPKELSPLMISGFDKTDNIFCQIKTELAHNNPVLCATELSPSCGQRRLVDAFHPMAGHNLSGIALPAIINSEGKSYYVEKLTTAPQLIIAGGGHVALAVAKIGALIGMQITVIEPRPEFATTERFPMAKAVHCGSYADELSRNFGENSYFVIVTHGHEGDTAALNAVLGKKCRYIGMIGSRRKNKLVYARLQKQGWPESRLKAVHAPIGLDIGAITPEEIAVSIMAEIIQVMNTHPESKNQPDLFTAIADANEPLVLATVIKKEGSAPRGVGARMLIKSDSTTIGTIGGGAAEFAAIQKAGALLQTGGAELFEYSLEAPPAQNTAMICGGKITVLLESVSP